MSQRVYRQTGVIVLGKGINWVAFVEAEEKKGRLCIFCFGERVDYIAVYS
jgi:hypothetical protein